MSTETKTSQSSTVSTKDLNRNLGRMDLMGMSIGQIIGAGIMSLTGVAISMTGRAVPLAFLIAAGFVIIMALASIVVGGTIRVRGGFYTQVGLLLGKKFSGLYILIFILTNISIAMYALSFADYMMSLVPGLPRVCFVNKSCTKSPNVLENI